MRNPIKLLVIFTALVVFLLIGFFLIYFTPKKAQQKITIDTKNQPVLGEKNAPVQIIAFEDLKCVNCKIFNNFIFQEINKKYVQTHKANYTLVLLAFIPGSIPAGNAAYCLYEQNPQYFFPFVEYLFKNQPPEETDWATSPFLLAAAAKSVPKANRDNLDQCIFTSKYSDRLQKNLELAAKIMQGKVATPRIYVNGVYIENLSLNSFEKAIEKELKAK